MPTNLPSRAALVAWTLLVAFAFVPGCTTPAASPPDEPPSDDAGAPDNSVPPPAEGSSASSKGQAPHVHDYWDGATSVTLLDETVPVMLFHNHLLDEPPREQHTHGCEETLASESQGGSRKFALPEGQIVLPGSGALEFLIYWSDPGITGLRLLYRPANEHHFLDAGLVPNGDLFQVSLTPEMADAGHSTRTQWAFFLCADGGEGASGAQGDVHTTIAALRTLELPLEPAHPDRWGDVHELRLAEAAWSGAAVAALNKGTEDAWFHVPLMENAVVPPGTHHIVVNATLNNDAPTEAALPGSLMLYSRDGGVPEWVYVASEHTSVDGNTLRFELAVDHDQVDGVYATQSNWDFWLRFVHTTHTTTAAGIETAPYRFEGTLTVDVTAHRAAQEI